MDIRKIEAMVTKFLEKLAILMLKKHRKFCRRGLTHLDAKPIDQIHMRHPVSENSFTHVVHGVQIYLVMPNYLSTYLCTCSLKVSKFQKQIFLFSFVPKNE